MAEITPFLVGLVGSSGFSPLAGSPENSSKGAVERNGLGADPSLNKPRAFLWQRAFHALAEWRRRIRERRELMSLDEYALHDIGLNRASAEQEARKPFWRP